VLDLKSFAAKLDVAESMHQEVVDPNEFVDTGEKFAVVSGEVVSHL